MSKYSRKALQEAVANSSSLADVLRILGVYTRSGGTWTHVQRHIRAFGLDTSHFHPSRQSPSFRLKSADERLVLVKGNHRESPKILRRCLKEIGLPYICARCLTLPVWNAQPLTLEVDHINGNWRDCRRFNLRFMCPNCHSQEETSLRRSLVSVVCPCGVAFRGKAKRRFCSKSCGAHYTRGRGVQPEIGQWPDSATLSQRVWQLSVEGVAKIIGVSGSAVRKRCKRLGIKTPPRGYQFTRDNSPGGVHTLTSC